MYKLIYPLAMGRLQAYIIPSDLEEALRLFKEQTSVDAQLVEVSEKIVLVLEGVLPEGLELLARGSASHYEIWLSSPQYDVKEVSGSSSSAVVQRHSAPNINPGSITVLQAPSSLSSQEPILKHPGRPRATGPYLSRTTRWRRMKESLKKQEALI